MQPKQIKVLRVSSTAKFHELYLT